MAGAITRPVDIGDTALFTVAVGAGIPLVALHGGMGLDHTYLRPGLDRLADTARVVYVDQRGNGRSPAGRPLAEIDLTTWADDLDVLCRTVGLGRIVLFGHSFGGFVAIECALRHPERIAGLVLCGTGAAFVHADAIVAELDRRNATEVQRQAFTGEPFRSDAEYAAWLAAALPLYLHPKSTLAFDTSTIICRLDALARGSEVLSGWDRRGDLERIHVPVLVTSGRHDVVMPVDRTGTPLAAALPNATSVVFDRSGHLPFLEEPDRYARVVRSWLASVPVDNVNETV